MFSYLKKFGMDKIKIFQRSFFLKSLKLIVIPKSRGFVGNLPLR